MNQAFEDFSALMAAGRVPDYDLASGMSLAASDDPIPVARKLGLSDPSRASVRSAMMTAYFGARARRDLLDAESATAETDRARSSAMAESMLSFAGVTGAARERMSLDLSAGDTLPMERVSERFYFD